MRRLAISLMLCACLAPGALRTQGFGFNERGPGMEQFDAPPTPTATETTRAIPAPEERPRRQGFFSKESYGTEEDLFAEGLVLPAD